MKKINTIYWILTGLLCVLLGLGAIPDAMATPSAIEIVVKHLGYPQYFLVLIGVAKILGVIAILIPGFPRVKEWAYAGFVFDLGGAVYSSIAVGDGVEKWSVLLIGIALIFASYIYFHKKLKLKEALAKAS